MAKKYFTLVVLALMVTAGTIATAQSKGDALCTTGANICALYILNNDGGVVSVSGPGTISSMIDAPLQGGGDTLPTGNFGDLITEADASDGGFGNLANIGGGATQMQGSSGMLSAGVIGDGGGLMLMPSGGIEPSITYARPSVVRDSTIGAVVGASASVAIFGGPSIIAGMRAGLNQLVGWVSGATAAEKYLENEDNLATATNQAFRGAFDETINNASQLGPYARAVAHNVEMWNATNRAILNLQDQLESGNLNPAARAQAQLMLNQFQAGHAKYGAVLRDWVMAVWWQGGWRP